MIQRKKRLNIKILESGLDDDSNNTNTPNTNKDIRCRNCKQWNYLVEQQTDRNNLFCTHCGSLTPVRNIKHSRGLAAPAIQQLTRNLNSSILQSKAMAVHSRMPHRIHDDSPRISATKPIMSALNKQGIQLVDSQYTEPVPQ